MFEEETLVNRVTELVGYDETTARNVIREIAKWLEEDGSHCGAKCAFRLEQEADYYG
jgi:hypothetical protein